MKSEAYWNQKYLELVDAGCDARAAAKAIDAWREAEITPLLGILGVFGIVAVLFLLVVLLRGWPA